MERLFKLKMGNTTSKKPEIKKLPTRNPRTVGAKDRFELGEKLGSGTFGSVLKALDKEENVEVAIKFMKKGSHMNPMYVKREILNHRLLCHPHVITFQEVFLTDKYLCIVMELAEGGTLGQHVTEHGCISEKRARWYFQQLIIATDYCHSKGVVMRDIKLNNLLLDKTKKLIKICDFGFSKHIGVQSAPNTKLGTASYIAPEILVSDQYDGKKADIWTCGIALFHMIYGAPPVDMHRKSGSETTKERLLRVRSDPIEIPDTQERSGGNQDISDGCKDMLSKLLIKNPDGRLTLKEIKEHEWFKQNLPEGSIDYNEEVHTKEERNVNSARRLQAQDVIEKLVDAACSE